MSELSKVQKWMRWYGWENCGNPGSVKLDANGCAVAKHGDAIWISDVELACEQSSREAIVAEFERRAALGSQS